MTTNFAPHFCFSILLAFATSAWSQTYPNKPVKIVVPYPAGTVTDMITRRLSDKAAIYLGQPIIIENRSGASGTIGAQAVARSPADGYTFLLGTNQTHAINSVVLKNQGYDPRKDFTPVARLVINSQLLAVNSGLGIRSVRELVELAKAKPNTLSFASAGKGTTAHLAGEYLKVLAGIDIIHVPYNSAQLMADLLAGRTSMIIYPYTALKSHIESGKLVPLATLGATRAPWMQKIPTMVESGYPDLVFVSWFGIYGPANLPTGIAERVSAAFCQALADPQLSANLIAEGSEPACSTPAVLAQFTNTELERTQQVVKRSLVTFEE